MTTDTISNTAVYTMGKEAGRETVLDDRERGLFKPRHFYLDSLVGEDGDYYKGFVDALDEFFE